MALPPFEKKDYKEEALDRVTEQFKEADIFKRYLITMIGGYPEVQDNLEELLQLRSIDTAFGAQLDIIGDIVGQPRVLLEASLLPYFGFQGAPAAESMGSLGSDEGGRFFDFEDRLGESVRLNDTQYRMFIRAKIFKNSFSSTPENFLTAVNHIFQTDGTYISSDGGGQATVFIGKKLSTFERGIINYTFYGDSYPVRLIPKTIGVRINFGEFQQGNYFGFLGSDGAKGFGTVNEQGEHGKDCYESLEEEDYKEITTPASVFLGYGSIEDRVEVIIDYNEVLAYCIPIDGGVFAELVGIHDV